MDECKPLGPTPPRATASAAATAASAITSTVRHVLAHAQGLTLAHFRAQLERFVWDRGCAQGLCSPRKGVYGVCRVLLCVRHGSS